MKASVTYSRDEARHRIVAVANEARQRRNRTFPLRMGGYLYLLPMFGRRHLQQAVNVVRQRGLVSPEVLVAAGFNAKRRP